MATCRDTPARLRPAPDQPRRVARRGRDVHAAGARADFVQAGGEPVFPARRGGGGRTWTHPGKAASATRDAVLRGGAIGPDLGTTETNATSSPTTLRAPVWADYASSGASPACGARRRRERPSWAARFWGCSSTSFPLAFAVGSFGSSSWCPPRRAACWSPWGTPGAATRRGARPACASCSTAPRARGDAPTAAAARRRPRAGTAAGCDEAVLMRQLWHAVGDAVTPAALGASSSTR